MDLPDVKVVVQYRATCGLCMLWQRFGRGARGEDTEATGVLLVEKKDTHAERLAKEARAAKRAAGKAKPTARAAAKGEEITGGKRTRRESVTCTPNKRIALRTVSLSLNAGCSPLVSHHHTPSRLRDMESPIDSCASDTDNDPSASDIEECVDGDQEAIAGASGLGMETGVVVGVSTTATSKKSRQAAKGKRAGLEVGDPLDLLINPSAHCHCRREPVGVYFGHWGSGGKQSIWSLLNRLADGPFPRAAIDPKLCDPDSPEGCTRCATVKSDVCCDLCSPELFKSFLNPKKSDKRAAGKSQLRYERKSWTVGSLALEQDILRWRSAKGREVYGANAVCMYGDEIFMADSIIERLVKAAHLKKIKSVDDLHKELDWNSTHIQKYGTSLISMILSSESATSGTASAEILPPTTPRSPRSSKKARKCSQCGQEGHYSKSCALVLFFY